jgi:ABC-type polysaccharide/polyol phosphate transport system ATPase subunit
MSAVRELATRAIWLEHGHVKMIGKASDIIDAYEAN